MSSQPPTSMHPPPCRRRDPWTKEDGEGPAFPHSLGNRGLEGDKNATSRTLRGYIHPRWPTAGRVALQNHLSLPLPHGRAGATSRGRHLWHQRHPARAVTQFPAVPASLQERPYQLPRSGAIPLPPSPGEHRDSCVPPPSPSGKQPDTRWTLPSQLSLCQGFSLILSNAPG